MKVIKKLWVIMLLAMIAIPMRADYTPEQKAFRSSVMSYLRNEGFAPKIDEDGDVAFKKEGDSYWIHIDDGDDDSFYVEFHGPSLSLEDANKGLAMLACNHVNLNKKCVKAIMNKAKTSIIFTVEMFCESASDFTSVFYRCVRALDSGYEGTKDYYSENDTD